MWVWKYHTLLFRSFKKNHDSQHTWFNIGRKTVNKITNSNLLPPWFFNSENPKFPAGNYNITATLMCAHLVKTIILTWLEGCVSPDIFPFSSTAACVCRSPAEREIALRLWLIAFLQRECERKPFAFVNLLKLWTCRIWCCFWHLRPRLPLSWRRLMSGVVQCT